MGVNLKADSYADFKLIVDSLFNKIGAIYYNYTAANGFTVAAVTYDLSSVVSGKQNTTVPPTFLTDFPNAIQLANTAPSIIDYFSAH